MFLNQSKITTAKTNTIGNTVLQKINVTLNISVFFNKMIIGLKYRLKDVILPF